MQSAAYIKERIMSNCRHEVDTIEVMYQCEFEAQLKTAGTAIYEFFNSLETDLTPKSKPPPAMAVRNGLRGGCVELFSLVAQRDADYEVLYFDINSLYPFIALKNKFVTG